MILFIFDNFFLHRLNSLKYSYLSATDPQPPSSSTFKKKIGMGTCLLQKNTVEEYSWDNHRDARAWHDQLTDQMGPPL